MGFFKDLENSLAKHNMSMSNNILSNAEVLSRINGSRYKAAYSRYEILSKPEEFDKLFINCDFGRVEVHSLSICLSELVGFCGAFSWVENKITPSDGDSYNPHMIVYGYLISEDMLSILVDSDW